MSEISQPHPGTATAARATSLKIALLGAGLPLLTSIILTSAVSLRLGPQQEALAGRQLQAVLQGQELPNRDEQIELFEAGARRQELPSLPPSQGTTTLRWPDGRWYLTATRGSSSGTLIARQPLDAAYAPIKSLQWLLLLCTLPLAALGALMGWHLGRRG